MTQRRIWEGGGEMHHEDRGNTVKPIWSQNGLLAAEAMLAQRRNHRTIRLPRNSHRRAREAKSLATVSQSGLPVGDRVLS